MTSKEGRSAWLGLALSLLGGIGAAAPLDGGDRGAAVRRAATETIEQLEQDVEHAHPVAMFLLSRRLFNSGRKDEAAFWFFEAQVRWRPFLRHEASAGQEQFARLFGNLDRDINFYASCDLNHLMATYDKVLAWDAAHADDFIADAGAKNKTRAEVKEIGDYARDHAEEMSKAHAGRKECEPPGADPYDNDAGPTRGFPLELLAPYDAARIASLRVGVTPKSEVVATLGPPEFWSRDGATSRLEYSYLQSVGGGLATGVRVSFQFDSRKVLTNIDLAR